MKKKKCVPKKMNGWIAVIFCSLLFSNYSIGQNVIPLEIFHKQGGIEVSIETSDFSRELVEHDGITIDHGTNHNHVHLYLTLEGYNHLKDLNIPFSYQPRLETEILMKSYSEILSLKANADCLPIFDFYPTYEAYQQLMQDFVTNYPDLCQLINIGTLSSGRDLLVLNIGDKLGQNEKEPNFFYTSTMHGDETAGFPIMIQYIDHLLCNYETDENIKNLLDNINIFINPLANPDGTYRNDNSTVANAQRRNSNQVDLNRNFPDPEDGENPDNRPTQEETEFFMEFAEEFNIHLACNIHGGAEVVNYPWDTFVQRPADNTWWIETCREYADSAQVNSPDGYLEDLDNGITNGFDWFEVNGGRQDYMNYVQRAREMTLEISGQKLLNSNLLPTVWEANRASLLNYMGEALQGLTGTITDCVTGEPVEAEIFLADHDINNSSVFSDSFNGDFYRFLDGATYSVQVIAEGYDTLFQEINIIDGERLIVDWPICKSGMSSISQTELAAINIIQFADYLKITNLPQHHSKSISLYSSTGIKITEDYDNNNLIDLTNVKTDGVYYISFLLDQSSYSKAIYISQ